MTIDATLKQVEQQIIARKVSNYKHWRKMGVAHTAAISCVLENCKLSDSLRSDVLHKCDKLNDQFHIVFVKLAQAMKSNGNDARSALQDVLGAESYIKLAGEIYDNLTAV